MTPAEVVTNIDHLDGRTVTVAGYLAKCSGYDCVLFSDKNQAKLAADWFDRFMAAARSHSQLPDGPPKSSDLNSLGIGSSNWECIHHRTDDCLFEFDRKAAPFQNSYVLITGRVTKMCRDKQGLPGCLDRSTDIFPHRHQAMETTG
jgi:hypothetical protein